MPTDDVSQISNDDYMELEIAHVNTEQTQTEEQPVNANLNSLRNQVAASKVNKSAIFPFWAKVELDLERPKQNALGLKNFFIEWLKNGNNFWLNPMDKTNGLGFLEEVLFKYQGNIQVLRPFVDLLTQMAKEKISPRAFAEYVILPRMRDDYNWRKWHENHIKALQIIAQLLLTAKVKSPFNNEFIGIGRTRLVRDIVLVRYVGRPLAMYPVAQLQDYEKLEKYKATWQKISLKEPLSLFFMRNNALHFIYIMSGKIDLIQLIAIVEQLPDIERSFDTAFPGGTIKLKNIQAINLYDYNIDIAIQERKLKGFHSLDYAVEIKAYFEIVKALLQKPTGVYLCAYYAGLLKRYKDPYFAETISRLVRVIDDRGGMHIYKWHTEKLLTQQKTIIHDYISLIENNHGCDPEYPRVHNLFRDQQTVLTAEEILAIANSFGLQEYIAAKDKEAATYRDLINAYISKHPDTKELINNFQEQLLTGKDRYWNNESIKNLDKLSDTEKNLYGPLMRSVIRGIGFGWAHTKKAENFNDLYQKYETTQSQMLITARTQFQMPIKPVGKTSSEKDALARKQINLLSAEKVWNSVCNTEQLNVNNVLVFINKQAMEINNPLEKAFENKLTIEKDLQDAIDDEVRDKLQKDVLKQNKTIEMLEEKRQQYSDIIENFDTLNDDQKFIAALILAGSTGKSEDSFYHFVLSLLFQRYNHLDIINSRITFLKDDISVDVLTYEQFTYMLNLLETLFFALRNDKKITDTLEKNDEVLQKMLSPYLITKKKELTADALEAAAKKAACYAQMSSDRAKWQGIIESMEEKDEKYYHNMEIYISKTFIDSYYGDMGGICLSARPDEILKQGFYVQRLANLTNKQIIGMSILYLSTRGFGTDEAANSKNYWQAFGFNPLSSVLSHLTEEQQLDLYLHFRLNMEKLAWKTKLPILISGIDTPWGLVSNNGHFNNIIKTYELIKPTAKKVYNAKGLSVYYSEIEFAKALLIIDPRGYEDLPDPSDVPTFYAHRELEKNYTIIPESI